MWLNFLAVLAAIGFTAGGGILLFVIAIVVDLRRSRGRGSAGQGAGMAVLVFIVVPGGLLVGAALLGLGVLGLRQMSWGLIVLRVLLGLQGAFGLVIAVARLSNDLSSKRRDDYLDAFLLLLAALVPIGLCVGL